MSKIEMHVGKKAEKKGKGKKGGLKLIGSKVAYQKPDHKK